MCMRCGQFRDECDSSERSDGPVVGVVIGAVFALGCVLALLCGGCASAYVVSRHDSEQVQRNRAEQAIALRAHNGGVYATIDVLRFNTGYLSAWKDDPGTMAIATVADAVIAGGAGYGIYRLAQSADGSGSDDGGDITINGNDNAVNTGTGNSGQNRDSHDQSGLKGKQ